MPNPFDDCRAKPDSNPHDVCPVCRAYLLLRSIDGKLRACADPQCKAAHGLRLASSPYGESWLETRSQDGVWSRLSDPPVERCLWCGTAVTPGSILGNALANGALPKMVEHAMRAIKTHTDETDELRKRVAELETGLRKARASIEASNWPDGWLVVNLIDDLLKSGSPASPSPSDPEFYLHRLDICRCGHRRGDHEGAQPQPCMWRVANGDKADCPCEAFVLVKAYNPRARSLEVRARVFSIALEVIERLTGGNFGDHGSANEIADKVMAVIGGGERGTP